MRREGAIPGNKTRLAPTPSGFLHLGNVLSFAITAEIATRHQARLLLRIDDLDQERVRQEYVQDIFDTLNFLEIPWDEGPADYREYKNSYTQQQRMHYYQDALAALQDQGQLFACTCSRTRVRRESRDGGYPGTCRERIIGPGKAESPDANWRLRTNAARVIRVKNLDDRIANSYLPASMRDLILRRKNGAPSYQLASLIDDLYFGVNMIIRGEDLWDSTLAQLYLAECLDKPSFAQARFLHHRLLTSASGDKLSKSAGALSVHHLRRKGKSKAEVFTLIASLLGYRQSVNNWQELTNLARL